MEVYSARVDRTDTLLRAAQAAREGGSVTHNGECGARERGCDQQADQTTREERLMPFRYTYKIGAFLEAMIAVQKPMAAAATAAMKEAVNIVKTDGRNNIRSAGFSNKWANALRGDVYPKPPKTSVHPAGYIYHKIAYAGVFEEGPTPISGKPLLWIPLPTTPKKVGGKKMTPAQYVRQVGPLISVQRPGGPPLLMGSLATGRRRSTKVSLTALRRAGQGGASRLVPLFVGVERIVLPDRFAISEITERAADRLYELYFKHLNPDG